MSGPLVSSSAAGPSSAPSTPELFAAAERGFFSKKRRRMLVDRLITYGAAACVIIALIPLGSILWTAVYNGGRVLSWNFITGKEYPAPCPIGSSGCQVGGIGPAIEGTLLLMAMAAAWAIPVSVAAAIYLSEYSRGGWSKTVKVAGRRVNLSGYAFGRSVSFLVDVLAGVPSIVVGLFVWTLFYLYDPNFIQSTYSQAVALGVIMLPIVTRTSEEALRSVPTTLREAAWGLGIPNRKTVSRVVLRTGLGPVLTGSLLAVTRAGGETAPLLLLGFSTLYPFQSCPPSPVADCFGRSVAALGPFIYTNGESVGTNNIAAAWGAALIFVIIMLSLSLVARILLRGRLASAGIGG